MGLDKLQASVEDSEDISPDAQALIETQKWLQTHARDIMDESDEILHVRYQLIYTSGHATALEGQPDRWQIIQEFFTVMMDHLKDNDYGDDLEITRLHRGTACFPIIRILSRERGRQLIEEVVKLAVFKDKFDTLSIPTKYHDAAFRYITGKRFAQEEASALLDGCGIESGGAVVAGLLLLRGLVAHDILGFSLREKRWRVDYGLDLSRSRMAVPFRAKDSPAKAAEFGMFYLSRNHHIG